MKTLLNLLIFVGVAAIVVSIVSLSFEANTMVGVGVTGLLVIIFSAMALGSYKNG